MPPFPTATATKAKLKASKSTASKPLKRASVAVVGVSNARAETPGFDRVVPRAKLREAAAEADFLIVLVPLDSSTHHLINAEIFAAMKPTSIIINIARGDVIDEAAMVEALQQKRIGGAGLDVFSVEPLPKDHPLWDMPNVMMSPRVGGMSDIYDRQILPVISHNLVAWRALRAEDLRNIVR